ncbi:MAG: hypothetical protein U1F46_15070 [Marinagarivorans sp.]
MKRFLILPLCCMFSASAYADLAISNLPHLEGTPFTAPQSNETGWLVLDSAQLNGAVQWAWLQQLGGKAYIIYPTPEPSVTFPDGMTFSADSQQVSLYFIDVPTVEFSRFGGKVVLEGKEVTARYSVNTSDKVNQGNSYTLSQHTIRIEGTYSGILTTSGQISFLGGTPFSDTFNLEGSAYISFDRLDTFNVTFMIDGATNISIDGMGGVDTLADVHAAGSNLFASQVANCSQEGSATIDVLPLAPESSQPCVSRQSVIEFHGSLMPGSLTITPQIDPIYTVTLNDGFSTSEPLAPNGDKALGGEASTTDTVSHDQPSSTGATTPSPVTPQEPAVVIDKGFSTSEPTAPSGDKASGGEAPKTDSITQEQTNITEATPPISGATQGPALATENAEPPKSAKKSKGGSIDWIFLVGLPFLGYRSKAKAKAR